MNILSQTSKNKAIPVDMLCSAMHISRATYYRHLENDQCAPDAPILSSIPVNALNDKEKQCVLDLLHSDHFIDKTPYDVYYELIDKGEYYQGNRVLIYPPLVMGFVKVH